MREQKPNHPNLKEIQDYMEAENLLYRVWKVLKNGDLPHNHTLTADIKLFYEEYKNASNSLGCYLFGL